MSSEEAKAQALHHFPGRYHLLEVSDEVIACEDIGLATSAPPVTQTTSPYETLAVLKGD